jgi:uncharacterized membrane protein YidH (DUF202 family)
VHTRTGVIVGGVVIAQFRFNIAFLQFASITNTKTVLRSLNTSLLQPAVPSLCTMIALS